MFVLQKPLTLFLLLCLPFVIYNSTISIHAQSNYTIGIDQTELFITPGNDFRFNFNISLNDQLLTDVAFTFHNLPNQFQQNMILLENSTFQVYLPSQITVEILAGTYRGNITGYENGEVLTGTPLTLHVNSTDPLPPTLQVISPSPLSIATYDFDLLVSGRDELKWYDFQISINDRQIVYYRHSIEEFSSIDIQFDKTELIFTKQISLSRLNFATSELQGQNLDIILRDYGNNTAHVSIPIQIDISIPEIIITSHQNNQSISSNFFLLKWEIISDVPLIRQEIFLNGVPYSISGPVNLTIREYVITIAARNYNQQLNLTLEVENQNGIKNSATIVLHLVAQIDIPENTSEVSTIDETSILLLIVSIIGLGGLLGLILYWVIVRYNSDNTELNPKSIKLSKNLRNIVNRDLLGEFSKITTNLYYEDSILIEGEFRNLMIELKESEDMTEFTNRLNFLKSYVESLFFRDDLSIDFKENFYQDFIIWHDEAKSKMN